MNIGNQPWVLSRHERALGVRSDLVVNYSTWLQYPADRCLGQWLDSSWATRARRLCFALSALAVGALSDRLGRRTPLMRGFGFVYVLSWLPFFWGGPLPVAATLALFALMGISISGATLVWAYAKEVNPPAFSGTSTSVVNTGGFLGPALLQPVVGLVLDLSSRGAAHSLDDWRRGVAVLGPQISQLL